MWSTETAGSGRVCRTRAFGAWKTAWPVLGESLAIVVALRAGRGRHQRVRNSSGFLGLVALCAVKAHNLLACEEGNILVKLLLYNNFYLVENSYAKFSLGPKKRCSFLG